MSGRQTKVINEQAKRYGLPFGGKSIDLTDKENKIMQLLVENQGRIVSYDLLSEYIWQESVPQNTIAAVVRRLRKKMDGELIQSVREQGYRLLK